MSRRLESSHVLLCQVADLGYRSSRCHRGGGLIASEHTVSVEGSGAQPQYVVCHLYAFSFNPPFYGYCPSGDYEAMSVASATPLPMMPGMFYYEYEYTFPNLVSGQMYQAKTYLRSGQGPGWNDQEVSSETWTGN